MRYVICAAVLVAVYAAGLATPRVQTPPQAALHPPGQSAEVEPVTRGIPARVRVEASRPLVATCKGQCHLTVAPQEPSVVEVPYRAADDLLAWVRSGGMARYSERHLEQGGGVARPEVD